MTIRQEEETPIGNYFHDSGAYTVFNALCSVVDDTEVESEQLKAWCDILINDIKGLKIVIQKCEKETERQKYRDEINDMIHRGAE